MVRKVSLRQLKTFSASLEMYLVVAVRLKVSLVEAANLAAVRELLAEVI
jgi:hypothetical protein